MCRVSVACSSRIYFWYPNISMILFRKCSMCLAVFGMIFFFFFLCFVSLAYSFIHFVFMFAHMFMEPFVWWLCLITHLLILTVFTYFYLFQLANFSCVRYAPHSFWSNIYNVFQLSFALFLLVFICCFRLYTHLPFMYT